MRRALVFLFFLSQACASEVRVQVVSGESGASLRVDTGEPLKLATVLTLKKPGARIDAESGGRAMIVSVVSEDESKPQLYVWLVREKSSWNVLREWNGKNAEHEFAFNDPKSVTRKSHCVNVESIPYTLECGCCNAIQTRTIETYDEEILAWNEKSRTVDQAKFSRWYVAQSGEGMINIVRKLYGDVRLLARLYRLNPELQKQTTLACGQRILVEQKTAEQPK